MKARLALLTCLVTSLALSITTARAAGPLTLDVRDLLVDTPDFERVDFARQAGQPAPAPQPTREQLVASLIDRLRLATGLPLAADAVRVSDAGELVANLPDAEARAVRTAIDDLRAIRGVQQSVETRFIELPAADVAKLPEPVRRAIVFGTPLDEAQATALIRSTQGRDATALTAPRVTLFDGQRAYVEVASATPYVADVKLTDGPAGPALEPRIEQAKNGVTLDVRVKGTPGRDGFALELRADLSKLIAMESVPVRGMENAGKTLVQRPVLETVKIDRLFGGTSGDTFAFLAPAATRTDGKPAAAGKALLVVVKTTTIRPAP
jgi:hypothetical protein